MTKKLKNFEESQTWQDLMALVEEVYKLTKVFPKEELYGLTAQLRRAVVPVPANLAEVFGRNGIKEKLQFYSIAYGSLLETKTFVYLAGRLGYCPDQSKLIERKPVFKNKLMQSKRQ